MIKKDKNFFTIKKNLQSLKEYTEYFFLNLYNCYVFGIGFDVYKYFEKTKYRLENLVEQFYFVFEKEKTEIIKQNCLEYLNILEKENEKNYIEFRTLWLKHWIFIYSYLLQKHFCLFLLKQLNDKKCFIIDMKKKLLEDLSDFRWDYQKHLVRVSKYRENYITKAVIKRKKKCKKKV